MDIDQIETIGRRLWEHREQRDAAIRMMKRVVSRYQKFVDRCVPEDVDSWEFGKMDELIYKCDEFISKHEDTP